MVSASPAACRARNAGPTLRPCPWFPRAAVGACASGLLHLPRGPNCKHVAAMLLEHLPPSIRRTRNATPRMGFAPCRRRPAATAAVHSGGRLARPRGSGGRAAGCARCRGRQTQPAPAALHPQPRDAVPAPASAALVRSVSVKLRKDGIFVEERRYDPNIASRPEVQLPQFLTADDIPILRDLVWVRQKAHLVTEADIRSAPMPPACACSKPCLRPGDFIAAPPPARRCAPAPTWRPSRAG